MKRLLTCLLALTFYCAYAQQIDSAWIVNNYAKKEVYIPMRDGAKLFTSVYMPKDAAEKHPILITRTPYSCAPYGEDKWKKWWNGYLKEYFKEGYIMVIQDVRGRWMSEGIFEDVRPFNANKKGKEIQSDVLLHPGDVLQMELEAREIRKSDFALQLQQDKYYYHIV